MNAPVPLRTLVLAIAAVAFAQLAPSCGGGSGGGGGSAPTAALAVEPSVVSVAKGSFFSVDVVISTTKPVQAYQVTVKWNPTQVSVVGYDAHEDFDDDGGLFGSAVLQQQTGTLSNVIDLRHGPATQTGDVRVATVWFFAGAPGTSSITVTGKAADRYGAKFATVAASPAAVTVSGS